VPGWKTIVDDVAARNDGGGARDNQNAEDMQSCLQEITVKMPNFFTGRMPFLSPNQQRRSTEGIT